MTDYEMTYKRRAKPEPPDDSGCCDMTLHFDDWIRCDEEMQQIFSKQGVDLPDEYFLYAEAYWYCEDCYNIVPTQYRGYYPNGDLMDSPVLGRPETPAERHVRELAEAEAAGQLVLPGFPGVRGGN